MCLNCKPYMYMKLKFEDVLSGIGLTAKVD